MIVERSCNPQFVSNTYLVADGDGGPAFFIDAGGPVEPLIEAAERLGLEPDPRAAHPPPLRPRQRGRRAARALARARGADQPARARAARDAGAPAPKRRRSSTGTVEAGQTLTFGALEVRAAAHARPHRRDALVLARSHERPRRRRQPSATAGRLHRRHALQGLGRRRAGARAHHLHRPARLDHGHADGAAARTPSSSPATPIRPRSRAEWDANPFIRVWRGLDAEGSEPLHGARRARHAVLLGADYDGGTKAWVRWPDGADDIVPGSRVRAPRAVLAPPEARLGALRSI